jgi:hypothetical protein
MIRRKEKGILLTIILAIAFLVMGIETNTVHAGNLALSGAEGLDAASMAGRAVTNLSAALGTNNLGLVYTGYQQLSTARESATDAYMYASYASGSGTAGTWAYYARIYADYALTYIGEAATYAYQAYTQNSVYYCCVAINQTGFFNMYMCTAIYNASQGSNGGRY